MGALPLCSTHQKCLERAVLFKYLTLLKVIRFFLNAVHIVSMMILILRVVRRFREQNRRAYCENILHKMGGTVGRIVKKISCYIFPYTSHYHTRLTI